MDEQLEVALKGGEFKRLLESQFSEIRKKYDLKKVDMEVLFFLSNCDDEDTPTDIYRHLKLNRGHVSQAIDDLCRRNLIVAIPDRNDRRFMHYKISDRAEAIIRDIASVSEEIDRKIFMGISEEEMILYKKITDKVYYNIRMMLGNK